MSILIINHIIICNLIYFLFHCIELQILERSQSSLQPIHVLPCLSDWLTDKTTYLSTYVLRVLLEVRRYVAMQLHEYWLDSFLFSRRLLKSPTQLKKKNHTRSRKLKIHSNLANIPGPPLKLRRFACTDLKPQHNMTFIIFTAQWSVGGRQGPLFHHSGATDSIYESITEQLGN